MKRMTLIAMLTCLFCSAVAWAQTEPGSVAKKPDIEMSLGYLYQSSNTVSGRERFGLNGGRLDVAVPIVWKISAAAELSGARASNTPGAEKTGLSLLNYMVGPRYSLPVRWEAKSHRIVPFVQALLGGTHAGDGQFPSGSKIVHAADSFAMSSGGGAEIEQNQRVCLRLFQAEYFYTRLPNLNDHYQGSLRIGAGIVIRLPR